MVIFSAVITYKARVLLRIYCG